MNFHFNFIQLIDHPQIAKFSTRVASNHNPIPSYDSASLTSLIYSHLCLFYASPKRYAAVDQVDAPCPHLKINRTRPR